jgi:hypothetical protein
MKPIPFIWSNDDIAAGLADPFERQLKLLRRWEIPGSFLLIPHSAEGTLDSDARLLRAIEAARGEGHEFFQHGYRHTPFESGVPATWMLEFDPAVRRQFDDRRLEIEREHTLEALLRMIDCGASIWRRAFGERSPGYRPAWGAICTNLLNALEELGFAWCSWRIPCATSWLRNNGRWEEPMAFSPDLPAFPTHRGSLVEYVLGGDYAFRVPRDPARIAAMVDLAMQELDYYHQRQWPMIICSHWHGLAWDDGAGYAVHEQLLSAVIESGKAIPMTFGQLHRAVAVELPS